MTPTSETSVRRARADGGVPLANRAAESYLHILQEQREDHLSAEDDGAGAVERPNQYTASFPS